MQIVACVEVVLEAICIRLKVFVFLFQVLFDLFWCLVVFLW